MVYGLELMKGSNLRAVLQALVKRVEVGNSQVTVMVRLQELAAFLSWDGVGVYRTRLNAERGQDSRVHCLLLPVSAVRRERYFKLPIMPCSAGPAHRSKPLIDLLRLARKAAKAVYDERDRTVEELAARLQISPAFFHRLRLNYLAPDIVLAIMDGRQPVELTRKRLAFASLPTDWAQQRAMLRFPAYSEPGLKICAS